MTFTSFSQPSPTRIPSLIGIVVIGIALVIAACFFTSIVPPSTIDLKALANQAEKAGELERAAEIIDRLLKQTPDDRATILHALQLAAKRERVDDAAEYLSRFVQQDAAQTVPIPDEANTLGLIAEMLFQSGVIDGAETCFRRQLKLAPENQSVAHTRMAFLLACEGRRWESMPHLMELLKQNQPSTDLLLWLGNPHMIVGDDSILESWHFEPAGLGLQLARAVRELARQNSVSAARQLIPLVNAHPQSVEAGIQLGLVSLELQELDSPSKEMSQLRRQAVDIFLRWHSRSNAERDLYPDLWVVRGRWMQFQQDPRSAIRCYAEAVRLNPDHQFAVYQLAQLLRDTHVSVAASCLERSKRLDELVRTIHLIQDNRQHVDLIRQAAEQTEVLGRLWEAWGWYRMALTIDPKLEWAWNHSRRLRSRLDSERPGRVLNEINPVADLDVSSFPLPVLKPLGDETNHSAEQSPSEATIGFEENSRDAGLLFTYFNSPHDGSGERSYEFTGGGVAVIDFDVDGWPDLYLTQGCRWPWMPGKSEHLDRLNRNIEGVRFEDVTNQCGIIEDRFGQGVTVGDFNSDGFSDLYVANIGPNRFLQNNGDGTFTDVTIETATEGNDWSTSCVLADVNSDGHPDLYVVNYITGSDVFDRICHDSDGAPRLCYPQEFAPAADRFYLNRGDGTFEDLSVASRLSDTTGRGLGIVAADFEGRGKIDLFVANDTTANFFFRNQTPTASKTPVFDELGIAAGLAFNASGQPQACMGVAAGDADQDGRLDLFVTNFEREYNNLYLQTGAGQFTDAIATSGIKEAGYLMLGFGTQFLDADLDGWPDLIVANGHIDDFSRKGFPYRMPPQFFQNRHNGRFRELPATQLGPYFQTRHLGRSAARLHWNRDGLDDLVIGHLGEPTALLTNRTPRVAGYLSLVLRGVDSSRDAIGTRIEALSGDRRAHYQLSAGDGYQASNDRHLIIGLADADHVEELRITWPTGKSQSFRNLPTNTEWIAIEGRDQLVQLTRDRRQP